MKYDLKWLRSVVHGNHELEYDYIREEWEKPSVKEKARLSQEVIRGLPIEDKEYTKRFTPKGLEEVKKSMHCSLLSFYATRRLYNCPIDAQSFEEVELGYPEVFMYHDPAYNYKEKEPECTVSMRDWGESGGVIINVADWVDERARYFEYKEDAYAYYASIVSQPYYRHEMIVSNTHWYHPIPKDWRSEWYEACCVDAEHEEWLEHVELNDLSREGWWWDEDLGGHVQKEY